MTQALENRVVPLRMPDLFFKSDTRRDFNRFSLDAAGAAEMRAALARGLATFKPAERSVLVLAALDHWTGGATGLKGFFVLSDSVFLEDALQALDAEGLAGHAALLREGAALFGPGYGDTQARRYDRWSDGHGEIRDAALDAALDRLSERFRASSTKRRRGSPVRRNSRRSTNRCAPARTKTTASPFSPAGFGPA